MSSDLVSELKEHAEKPQDASDIKTLEDGKAELEKMKNLFEKFTPSGKKRNAAFVRGFREERREIDRNGCQDSGVSESGEHGV